MMEFEVKTKEVWEKMATAHPEFKPEHDALKNPWALEALLLGPQINTEIFPDGNVLDIGSNGGILTAYWALNGAHVTAYEADPITFRFLNDMLRQTNLNAVAVWAAIWTFTGLIRFRSNLETKSLTRGGCISVQERPTGWYEGGENQEYEVPCVSFEVALNQKEWDCVKMDIEGAEFEILRTTPIEVLRNQIKYMQLEFHHEWVSDAAYQELIAKLDPVFRIDGHTTHEGRKHWPGRYLWAHLRRK